jgi:PAS domain S-box-containing protein
MITPPTLPNEDARLKSLASYDILDTPPEEAYDDLAKIAAHILGTPVGLVTFVGADHQHLKARVGIDADRTARDVSFCAHGIATPDDVLVVSDATADERFHDNPLVADAPGIRFYAGARIQDADGNGLGSVCAIDTKPRDVTPEQIDALRRLSKQATALLALRKAGKKLDERCRELSVLERIVSATNSGVMLVDADNVITYTNRSFTKTTGYGVGDKMGICPREILCGPDSDTETIKVLRAYVARQEPVSGRLLSYAKDGRTYWSSAELQPIRDDDGAFAGYLCVEQDVTKAHATEERLAASEARFQRLARNMPGMLFQAVLTPGAAMRFPYVSDRCVDIYGVTAEQIYADGSVIMDAVHPDDADQLAAAIGHSFETLEVFEWQGRVRHTSGQWKHLHVRSQPERQSDGSIQWDGVMHDETDAVAVQGQLAEERERSSRIVGNVPGMVYQHRIGPDGDAKFAYVSDGCRDIYGLEPAAILEDANVLDQHLHPADMPKLMEAIKASVASDTRIDVIVRHLPKPADPPSCPMPNHEPEGTRWLNILARARVGKDGQTLVTDGIVLDVTRQVMAEREMAAATKRAEAASVAKSAFLANMSHEIRTPLSHVISFGDLLRQNLHADAGGPPAIIPLADTDRLHAATTICSSGKHLLTVLNDILDLSKIEAGKMEVESVATNPMQIAEEVVSLMRVTAIGKGLTLDLAYDGPLPTAVLADPTRLRQSLLNVVGNAIKFTETGGVLLRLGCGSGEEPSLEFNIVDTGIGMTDAQQQKLFQSFSQADESTTRKFGGTGLGLAVSRKLVRLMGGDMTCHSVAGQGSTFTLTLPFTLSSTTDMVTPNEMPPQSTDASGPLAGRRLLVVEDGPENQWLIGIHLRNAGAIITNADDGRAGVATATADGPFDAVLMDMQMPVMDGYAATAALRQAGYEGPIVAFTAHAMSGDREKCLAAGCDAYHTKPIDGPALVDTLANLITAKSQTARAA